MKQSLLILIFLTCVIHISCKKILLITYGIKDPKFVTKDDVREMSKKLKINLEQSFILNKEFFNHIEKKDTLKDKSIIKCSPMISKYEQPLQLFYFNDMGTLISFHNNCYAGGFPKLKWNRDHQFSEFIPRSTIPITDSALTLSLLETYLDPIISYNKFKPNDEGSTIILFWSGFMMKQSKELIETARENLKLDFKRTAKIFYVNTDNCFVEEKYAKQINHL